MDATLGYICYGDFTGRFRCHVIDIPKEKEKPMDRTEEVEALREFTRTHPNTFGDWLDDVVEELQMYGSMIGMYSEQCQSLLRLLVPFGVIEAATSNGPSSKITWEVVGKEDTLYPSNVYRISPDYKLPDLTEETPPRFKEGTWLFVTDTKKLLEVIDRERNPWPLPNDISDDWCAVIDQNGDIGMIGLTRYDDPFERIQELPTMPDKDALAKQGYELTMEAADCSKKGHVHEWVNTYWGTVESSGAYSNKYNGWRWLVRKIEKKEEEFTGWTSYIPGTDHVTYHTAEGILIHIPPCRGPGTWKLTFTPE